MKSKNIPPIVISAPPQNANYSKKTSPSQIPRTCNSKGEFSNELKQSSLSPKGNYSPNYNYKNDNKVKKQFSYLPTETELITSQEFLIDQKWHLLEDIEQLRYEIEPLNSEIQNLNLYINKTQGKLAQKQEKSQSSTKNQKLSTG